MKKVLTALIAGLTLLVMTGVVQATLITIGLAHYMGSDYKLIYDDDDTGYGGGGLVWLDCTHSGDTWANQVNWASGLGSSLTVTLDPGYTTDIDWTTGWHLPTTVDGPLVYGYEGDPDNDGGYNYTGGWNLANSELGHLYYEELGNLGWKATGGTNRDLFGLANTGDFDNLTSHWYWSGTTYADNPANTWGLCMYDGMQDAINKSHPNHDALAVHTGTITDVAPVPEPSTMLLVSTGLLCLAGFRKKFKE